MDAIHVEPFSIKNPGSLALDAVDDDDFDFFETKQSSAEDSSAKALTATDAVKTPIAAVMSPQHLGQTPNHLDASIPFVFSPPPGSFTSPASGAGDLKSPPSHHSPITKSTPNTAGPTTPGFQDTPRSQKFCADFEIIQITNDSECLPCPPAWLPFHIDTDALFNFKWGKLEKWSYVPMPRKIERISIKKYRPAKGETEDGETKNSLLDNAYDVPCFYPFLDVVGASETLPFAKNVTVYQMLTFKGSFFMPHFKDQKWTRKSIYQYLNQLYFTAKNNFGRGIIVKDVAGAPRENYYEKLAVDQSMFRKIIKILKRELNSDPVTEIALENFMKYDGTAYTNLDEEDENFATYGTIRLRKKNPEGVFEILTAPQISVMHHGAQLFCNHHILKFWDNCRLAPIGGSKDFAWVAVFPKTSKDIYSQRASVYMSQFASMWDLLSFGKSRPLKFHESKIEDEKEREAIEKLNERDRKERLEQLEAKVSPEERRDKEMTPGLVPIDISGTQSEVYERFMCRCYDVLPYLGFLIY